MDTTINTQTDYSYDGSGRLYEVKEVIRNGIDVSSEDRVTTYTYDANGNREYITLPGNRITGYYYDSMNRLTDLYNYVSTPQYNPEFNIGTPSQQNRS